MAIAQITRYEIQVGSSLAKLDRWAGWEFDGTAESRALKQAERYAYGWPDKFVVVRAFRDDGFQYPRLIYYPTGFLQRDAA